jgi:hypothetical protein
VLFLGHIYFTSRAHDVSGIRKCKDIITIIYLLSMVHLELHRIEWSYSLACKWYQHMFRSFVHRIFLHTIGEALCMSGYLFASKTIRSEPRLRFIPVMVTRLMLSLKKAAASQKWNFGEPTTHTTMRFAERRGSFSTRNVIHLDVFASMHEGTQSREWWCKRTLMENYPPL